MDNILDKWLPIMGNIESEGNILVFKGKKNELRNPMTGEMYDSCSTSLLLNKQNLTQGTISADITISEKTSLGTQFLLIYNYTNNNGSMKYDAIGINIAGEGTIGSFYAIVQDFNSEHISFFGSVVPIGEEFNIGLVISGSRLYYSVKGIQIFSSDLAEPIVSDRIGFYCRSDVEIQISNFSINAIKPKAFVIMKYEKVFDVLYNDVIKPICNEFNYNVMRADENYSTGVIIDDIIEQLYESSLIIAEITPDNPNVYYELGYAHALNKPTILLCDKNQREHLPFDVSGHRVIFYDNSIYGKSDVENRLKKYLESMSVSL